MSKKNAQVPRPHEEAIESAWESLCASWDTDDAHRKFLALCESFGRLDAAGQRYRQIAESDDPRAASAQKRIDQLVVRAMATMQMLKEEPSGKARTLVLLLGVALVVVLLSFAASFFV